MQKSSLIARLGFKRFFHISKHIGLKNRHLKEQNVTPGGVGGEKCHVLFEWPLIKNESNFIIQQKI